MQAAQLQQPMMFATQYQQHIAPSFTVPITQHLSHVPESPPDVNQQVQQFLTGYQNGDAQPVPQFDFSAWGAQHSGQEEGYGGQNQQRWDGDLGTGAMNQHAGRSDENQNPKKKRGYDSKQWTDGPLDENGEYKGKKKPCRFFREGKCTKGPKCTYLHD